MRRNTSISQRWEAKFVEKTKNYARVADCSTTQFTIDAITLLGNLLEFDIIIEMDNHERIDFIKKALIEYNNIHKDENNRIIPSKSKKKADRIREYLINNPNHIYSTNDLAKILDINQSTVRTYVAKLANDLDFKLYEGRPNKIEFIGSISF